MLKMVLINGNKNLFLLILISPEVLWNILDRRIYVLILMMAYSEWVRSSPLNTGRKLNVHKTFKSRPVLLLDKQ